MRCLNSLCVYEKNGKCTNENVEIDWRGNCSCMINIRLTKDTLEKSKWYTKLISEHNDDYYFNDETGEFIYLEDNNKK